MTSHRNIQRFALASLLLSTLAGSASADIFNFTVDSAQSSVNINISATVNGRALSDSDSSSLTGFVNTDLLLPAFSFEQLNITDTSLALSRNLRFDLVVFLLGGVRIDANNLVFGIPGPTGSGIAGPPTPVALDGSFNQTGNLISGSGTILYSGVGILGGGITPGSMNLADQPAAPGDFAGSISQSGSTLRLQFPLSTTQTFDVDNNGTIIPVTIVVNGTVRANATTNATGWKVDADGNVTTAGNFSGGLPGASFPVAVFGPVISAARTVTIDAPLVVDRLDFSSPHAYTLTPSSPNSTASINSRIRVLQGSHRINTAVNAGQAFTLEVGSNSSLALTRLVQSQPLHLLNIRGTGSAEIERIEAGRLAIDNASVRVAHAPTGTTVPASRITQLTLSDGASLDVGSSGLVVDYNPLLAIPVTPVRDMILAGYNNGAWNGAGILSSLAQANSSYGVGYAESFQLFGLTGGTWQGLTIDSSAILVRATLLGDSNLDGVVGFTDLLALARNYNQAGNWIEGDSDYDGTVGFTDLLALARNYGQSLASDGGLLLAQTDLSHAFQTDFARAVALVPEPSTLLLMMAAPAILRARPRRSSRTCFASRRS